METEKRTSDFIELHRVTKWEPDKMTAEPIVINRRYVRDVFSLNVKSVWNISRSQVELSGMNITVTETYEEVKKMLMD